MFESLLKLAAEPEKLPKLGFLIIRIVLSLVLGNFLFHWWFEKPFSTDLTSFPSLLEMLFNGMLICIVLSILFANYLLFKFLPQFHGIIPNFLNRKLTLFFEKRRADVLDNGLIFILKISKIIKKQNEKARATTGKRFDKFVHYFYALKNTKIDAKDGTFIIELYNTFWALLVVSLAIMKPIIGYSIIVLGSIAMIIWCLLTIIGITCIVLLKEVYQEKLEFIIKWMWTERLLFNELRKRGIIIRNFENRADKNNLIEANYNEHTFYIVYINTDYPDFTSNDLFKFIKKFLRNSQTEKVFIITEGLNISFREQVVYLEMNEQIIHFPIDNIEDEQVGWKLYYRITDSFRSLET